MCWVSISQSTQFNKVVKAMPASTSSLVCLSSIWACPIIFLKITLGGVFCSSRCVVRSTWVSPSDHDPCNLVQHTVYWTLSHSSLQISNYVRTLTLSGHPRFCTLTFNEVLCSVNAAVCFHLSHKECRCPRSDAQSSGAPSCFNLGWHSLRHRLPLSVHQSSWYTTGPPSSPWIIPCVFNLENKDKPCNLNT